MRQYKIAAGICLSGGLARRLGGVSKSALPIEGKTLLDRSLHALQAHGASRFVVVGPREPLGDGLEDMASISDSHGQVVVYHENYDTPQVQFLTEDPPHSGPAWATAAGIAALSFRGLLPDDLVAVVSVDLPFLDLGLDALLTSDNECTDRSHTLGITSSGHQQWLLGVHRWDALRSLSAHAQPNQSLMSLFADVHPTWVVIEDEAAHDIDTPEDLATVLATLGCADSVREDSRATPAEQTLNDDDIGQYALPS